MLQRSKGEKIFNVFNICLMTLLSVITIYPFLYVIFASFSDGNLLMQHQGILYKPLGFSLDAYIAVFHKQEIWIGYKNTLFYVVCGTMINIAITVPLAYALSKKAKLIPYITMMIVFTMYFGGGLIPTYLVVQRLGLLDTRWSILLPTAVSTFNLILMRSAFVALPQSLEEAALIDGAGVMKILWKIALPLVKPSIAVIVLYYGVAQWNQWFQAMLYIRNQDLYPLQIFLRDILIENSDNDMMMGVSRGEQQSLYEAVKYSSIVVSTVPILILYPFLQKYFVQGMMIGAVKE